MTNELRTYRLFAVDTVLASGRKYSTEMVEKAIAQCKKPFYVIYDINNYDVVRESVEPAYICGFTDGMWVESGFLWVRFKTYFHSSSIPDIWNKEPNSLSILPVAVGKYSDTAKLEVIELRMFAIAISKTNKNQISTFIKSARILRDPFIGITK